MEFTWISIALVFCISLHTSDCYSADDVRTFLDATIPTTGSSLYYPFVRPKTDQSQVVDVTADLYLIGINGFDNAEQKLTTTAYLQVNWTDEIIAANWQNAAIDSVYVPQSNVWKPDLALKNGFVTMTGLGSSFLYVKVSKTGDVIWMPYHVFDSGCEIDVTFFPFDKTTCDLTFVIWSNTVNRVKVTKGTVGLDMTSYEVNSEWDILSVSASDYETSTSSGVTFTIEMRRKPLYYLLNILIPVILLGVLNCFVFVLPASAGEKVGYSVTAFLSFAVFLTIISTELPQNSEKVSTFSAYIFIMTVVSTIIVTMTIFQLYYYHRGDDSPVTRTFSSLVMLARKIQCACCVGSGRVAIDEKIREDAEKITWTAASDSFDFLSFWLTLAFMLVFTAIIVSVSAT